MNIPFPNKKYKVLYLDPPWQYNDTRATAPHKGGAVHYQYPTMSFEEIRDLPIKDISDRNALMFMWITYPMIMYIEPLMNAWGFKYKTIAYTWIKTNKGDNQPFLGVGHYSRSNAEIVALGRRGNPKIVNSNTSSVVISPRLEHSRKPDEVRKRIETMCGDVPRIELFARQAFPGWDAWGLEAPSYHLGELLDF